MLEVGYIASNKTKSGLGRIDYRDLDLLRRPVNLNSEGYGRVGSCKLHILVMARILGGPIPKGKFVDHKNRDRLDNTRKNLRLTDCSGNSANVTKFTGSSKFIGVHWSKRRGKWYSQIKKSGKVKYLGVFDNEEDAAEAYNSAALELHGEFANLNKV